MSSVNFLLPVTFQNAKSKQQFTHNFINDFFFLGGRRIQVFEDRWVIEQKKLPRWLIVAKCIVLAILPMTVVLLTAKWIMHTRLVLPVNTTETPKKTVTTLDNPSIFKTLPRDLQGEVLSRLSLLEIYHFSLANKEHLEIARNCSDRFKQELSAFINKTADTISCLHLLNISESYKSYQVDQQEKLFKIFQDLAEFLSKSDMISLNTLNEYFFEKEENSEFKFLAGNIFPKALNLNRIDFLESKSANGLIVENEGSVAHELCQSLIKMNDIQLLNKVHSSKKSVMHYHLALNYKEKSLLDKAVNSLFLIDDRSLYKLLKNHQLFDITQLYLKEQKFEHAENIVFSKNITHNRFNFMRKLASAYLKASSKKQKAYFEKAKKVISEISPPSNDSIQLSYVEKLVDCCEFDQAENYINEMEIPYVQSTAKTLFYAITDNVETFEKAFKYHSEAIKSYSQRKFFNEEIHVRLIRRRFPFDIPKTNITFADRSSLNRVVKACCKVGDYKKALHLATTPNHYKIIGECMGKENRLKEGVDAMKQISNHSVDLFCHSFYYNLAKYGDFQALVDKVKMKNYPETAAVIAIRYFQENRKNQAIFIVDQIDLCLTRKKDLVLSIIDELCRFREFRRAVKWIKEKIPNSSRYSSIEHLKTFLVKTGTCQGPFSAQEWIKNKVEPKRLNP